MPSAPVLNTPSSTTPPASICKVTSKPSRTKPLTFNDKFALPCTGNGRTSAPICCKSATGSGPSAFNSAATFIALEPPENTACPATTVFAAVPSKRSATEWSRASSADSFSLNGLNEFERSASISGTGPGMSFPSKTARESTCCASICALKRSPVSVNRPFALTVAPPRLVISSASISIPSAVDCAFRRTRPSLVPDARTTSTFFASIDSATSTSLRRVASVETSGKSLIINAFEANCASTRERAPSSPTE